MASESAGTIVSEVRIDLEKLRGDSRRVLAEYKKIGTVGKQQAEKVQKSFEKSSKLMSIAAVAGFAAVTSIVKSSLKAFGGFEQAMANVASVSKGSKEDLEALGEAALKAGASTRYSASESAGALYVFASAGLTAKQSQEGLTAALTLAAATQSDVVSATQASVDVMKQFKLEAKDSTRISNVYAAAVANSSATMEKLQGAMKYAGVTASGLGFTLEDTVGVLQIMFDAGLKGEQAGTGLRAFFSRLSDSSGTTVAELKKLGVAFEDINPATNSLSDIIEELNKAGVDASNSTRIFGETAGLTAQILSREGAPAFEEYRDAITGTNAASKATEVQNATLKGLFDKLKSSVGSLQIEIGGALNPAMQSIVRLIKNIVDWISKADPLVLGLGTTAITAALGVGTLTVAMKALGIATKASTPLLSIIIGVLSGVGGGIATFTANARKLKIENLAKEFSGIGAAAGLTGEQINTARESFEKSLLQIEKIGGVNTVVRASNEKLAASIESIAETLGKTTDETLALIDVEKDRHDEIKETIRLNEEYEESIQAISDAENESMGIFTQTEEAIEKQKELKETLSDRAKAEQEALAAIAVLNTQANEGLIEQEELIQGTIAANNQLIESLYALGVTQEGGGDDAETLRNVVAHNEALLEQVSIQEEKAIADETAASALETAGKVTDEYIEKLKKIGATDEELIEIARSTALAQVDGHDAATDAVNKYYDALVNEEKIEEAKEQAASFQESLRELFFSGAESASSIAGSIADIQIAENNRVLQSQLEAQGLEEETKIQKLEKEVKAAEKAAKKEKDVKKKENLLQLAEEKKKELARAKLIKETEKKNAQVRYRAALAQWGIQATTAAATAAQAILTAIGSAPPPLNIPAIAATTFAAGAQVLAIGAAIPQPPALQSGGLVLPSKGGQVVKVAENSHSEIMFNSGLEGQAFTNYVTDRITKGIVKQLATTQRRPTPIEIRVPVIINEEMVAEVIAPIVVDEINNGLVELEK